ncbi:TPA: metal ABC transporter permease, partial [Klebsiella pneumoniae]|nr:metal ABC transporter permease [Klebsiella pneumoniae]
IGTVVSFHIDGATGACIVLVQALYFVLALIYNQLRLSALKRRRQVA